MRLLFRNRISDTSEITPAELPGSDGVGESTAIGVCISTGCITEVSDGEGVVDIFINGDGDISNGRIVVVNVVDVDGDGGGIGA